MAQALSDYSPYARCVVRVNASVYQHGAAIITALLIVVIVATVAFTLLAQQSESLTRVARATERTQLILHANTTLEWARTALLLQQRNTTYISLSQPWAQGLVARPIETATAVGALRDAQSKFNVNNLIDASGKRREADVEIFTRLLAALKLDSAIANALVDWLDSDDDVTNAGGAENGYYWNLRPAYRAPNRAITTIDEIRRVKGIDDDTFNALIPYITALPTLNIERTRINVNTTSNQLLQAVFNTASAEDVTELLRRRELPYSTIEDLKERNKTFKPATIDAFLDTKSRYFEASLAITGEVAQVRLSALLQLQNASTPAAATTWPAIIWLKEE
jgi:general secretion pathway protein K